MELADHFAPKVRRLRLGKPVGGYYRRTLGKWVNAKGNLAPKTFLLGKNRREAERANRRLEDLWVQDQQAFWAERDDAELAHTARLIADGAGLAGLSARDALLGPTAGLPADFEPQWSEFGLQIAEVVRKGGVQFPVPRAPSETEAGYAVRCRRLGQRYRVIDMVAEDGRSTAIGDALNAMAAHTFHRQATTIAPSTQPVPKLQEGPTFYAVIDRYCQWAGEHHAPATAKTEQGNALRFKDATRDVPLAALDYNQIERVADYFRKRPEGKKTGKPIAVDTVINHLKTFSRLLRWLEDDSETDWSPPPRYRRALRANRRTLRTQAERDRLAQGPPAWSIDELAALYGHATDTQRLLMLLGLNFGFAQSECLAFNPANITTESGTPIYRALRPKSERLIQIPVWRQTTTAIEWFVAQRPADASADFLVTTTGSPMCKGDISNAHNRLVNRIKKDSPGFRSLSFKYFRKTAGALVRRVSDGETVGVFHARSQVVSTDAYSDAYTQRPYERVAKAVGEVHDLLQPMFDAAPDAFTTPRARGSHNITRGKIRRIQQLHRDGLDAARIAKEVGVSQNTVYRHTKALRGRGKGR